MSQRIHAFLACAVRVYLGIVFLMACVHKIAHPDQFAMDVATYQFLPVVLIHPFAIVLPWTELIAGVMLLVGWRVRSAALLVSLMMVSFMIALTWALTRELNISCGCFASQAMEQDPISWWTMLRDAVWLVMSVYVVLFDHIPLGVDGWLARRKVMHA